MTSNKKKATPGPTPSGAGESAPDIEKIIVITRQTRLEESIKRFNTIGQAKYFVESRGQSFDDYVLEYDNYQRARDALVRSIPSDIRFQVIDRTLLPNFLFGPRDLAMPLGQDGLVVNTAKYLNGQPVLAFNPDPDRFDGILLPFLWNESDKAIAQALETRLRMRSISMARADLNDGQFLYAFNDFFVGADSHVSARYTLEYRQRRERHSSSGVIVSTPAGSTGWLSSLYNMAAGIQAFAGSSPPAKKTRGKTQQGPEKTRPAPDSSQESQGPAQKDGTGKKGPGGKGKASAPKSSSGSDALRWEDRKLVFMVREPFRSNWSGADIVAGEIQDTENLVLESHMPEGGVIFSDGMLDDFIQFNSGATVRIGLAEKSTRLLVPGNAQAKG